MMRNSSNYNEITVRAKAETSVLRSAESYLNIFLELIKFRITILVSFTTALGYILEANGLTMSLFYPITGIFLLACSSSTFNHFQESDTDALMSRTKSRPIPSGRVLREHVLMLSLVLLIAGSAVLFYWTNIQTLLIGLFTFVWYNGVYTPLKRKTSFAIIPGALVGALPPIAGWTAAGGSLLDSRIIIVAIYFFIWQIPHFWLLLMIYGDDYKKGGFPVLCDVLNKPQLKRITFIWLLATVMTALLIPLFGIINYSPSNLILMMMSGWMVYCSVRFYMSDADRKQVVGTFVKINFYTMMLITLLISDKVISILKG